ncbi:MAG: glycosyltransferase [Hydrogenophaga sp.]|nr:glycosyltransferase [Hydrogenophaga sp.]
MIVTLLKHLDRSRFRLSLAVIDVRGAVFRDDIPSDVEFIDLGVTRVRHALPKIVALIWNRRPDVVFSTLGHLNLALSIIRFLLPREVRTIARETSIVSATLQTYAHPGVWAMLYRRFYPRHDLVVCQSRYMNADLIERFGFSSERSVVINNPVDIDHIRRLASSPLDHAGSMPGRLRLVAAGRLSEVKGFDLLIEALGLLNNPNVHLCILGEGLLLNELKQLAVSNGVANQIDFVGFQANPYAWFARADAFVLSSRHEGFPNVVLEALACGTPVIATPAPGGTREILDSFVDCVVAESVSAQALATAIASYLSGMRRRISPSALMAYAPDRIVRQYEQVLEGA